MTTRVVTQSTCDRCGKVEERPATQSGAAVKPVEWARAWFSWPSNNNGIQSFDLCPPCGEHVEAAMQPEEGE